MQSYIALIHKDADSDYGVSFPDLPGCITAGTTLDEAMVFTSASSRTHRATFKKQRFARSSRISRRID